MHFLKEHAGCSVDSVDLTADSSAFLSRFCPLEAGTALLAG